MKNKTVYTLIKMVYSYDYKGNILTAIAAPIMASDDKDTVVNMYSNLRENSGHEDYQIVVFK